MNRTRVPPILLAPDLRRSRATQAAALAVALLAARIVNPDRPLPFDVCALKTLTGFPCPACGLTRSLCHALRGEWAASLGYHPAGVLLAAALIGWMVWSAAEARRGCVVGGVVRRRLCAALLTSGVALSIVSWVVGRA